MIIESLDDFRRRYRHTYLFLEIDGKEHLVNYEGDDEKSFTFSSPQFGALLVNEKTAREKISFHFPRAGLYNIGDGLVDFSRNPARQWRRAPCSDNTRFVSVLNNLNPDLYGLHRIRFGWHEAENVFFPVYPKTTEEALENLPKFGRALNHKIGFTRAPKNYGTDSLIWFRSTPVGTVNKSRQEITVKYSPLYQEIYDHYMKKEPTWKVHLKT